MKNITVIIFKGFILQALLIIIMNFMIPAVSAADSTPSADIRAKLEELKKEIASKAAKLRMEVDKKLKDKAILGRIKNISENTLTLDTKNGPKTVNMNQDTLFGSDTNLKYAKKLLEKDDYVASLGDVDDTSSLTAKKIILLPTPDPQPKTYLWGQIVSISEEQAILKGRDLKKFVVKLPEDVSGKVADFVILTGKAKKDIFEAEFVYVKPSKPASHSASPSGSPRTF